MPAYRLWKRGEVLLAMDDFRVSGEDGEDSGEEVELWDEDCWSERMAMGSRLPKPPMPLYRRCVDGFLTGMGTEAGLLVCVEEAIAGTVIVLLALAARCGCDVDCGCECEDMVMGKQEYGRVLG